jgi:amino acid adenylation domain-containing protein/non-ribosomal peptide synthase protein (TIGR01720 family)
LLANQYSYVSLSKLQELTKLRKGESLFGTLVAFENYPNEDQMVSRFAKSGLKASNLVIQSESNYDLTLIVTMRDSLEIEWLYKTDRYDETTTRMLVQAFESVMLGITTIPTMLVKDLPIAPHRLEERLLHDWNATEREFSDAPLLHEMFIQQALRHPGAVALVDQLGSISYEELLCAAVNFSRELSAFDLNVGDVVAIRAAKGRDQVIAALGTLIAGGVYLPLERSWPEARCDTVIKASKSSLVLADRELRETAGPSRKKVTWTYSVEARFRCPEALLGPIPEHARWRLAYVIYTSGTTGSPKGVAIEHKAVVNTLLDVNSRFSVGSSDKILAVSAFSFDLSVYDIFGVLGAGGSVVFPDENRTNDPTHWLELIKKFDVSIWNSVPASVELLVDALEVAHHSEVSQLRTIMMSGDWIPTSLPKRIWQFFPQSNVYSLGGATEASIWSICYPITEDMSDRTSVPYGRPMANQKFFILDTKGRPCPQGIPGELHIGGSGLATAYYNDADQTEASFFEHPKLLERLYRTGDFGRYLPTGEIEFLGRKDNQIKLGGYRIELGEVETQLKKVPGISDILVLPRSRENQRVLVAYAIGAPSNCDKHALEAKVFEHAHKALPSYMIPVTVIWLDQFPLTSNLKIDRNALPDPVFSSNQKSCELPQSRVEAILCGIWAEVLEIGDVGVTDNFFELGGDSIKSIQIVVRCKRAGLNLSIEEVFEYQTIREIVENADIDRPAVTLPDTEQFGDKSMLEALKTKYPQLERMHLATPVQSGMLYHSQVDPGAYVVRIQASIQLRDIAQFQSAWQTVMRRHDVLRSCFSVAESGEFVQIVETEVDPPWKVFDISMQSELQREQEIARFVEQDRLTPFDEGDAPLMRFSVFRTGDQSYSFHWTYHHAILDAWSVPLVLREVILSYSLARLGPVEHVPQFGTYAAWLASRDESAAMRFWSEKLRGAEYVPLKLSFGGKLSERRIRQQEFVISEARSTLLREFIARERTTLASVMQAAWATVLCAFQQTQDPIFGVTVAGRPAEIPNVDSVVGMFLNSIPIRIRVPVSMQLGAWLREVHQQFVEYDAHSFLSLRKLKKLVPESETREIFDSLLVIENAPFGPEVRAEATMAGIAFSNYSDVNFTNYPITLTVDPRESIRLTIDYWTGRCDPAMAEIVLGCFAEVVWKMVSQPNISTCRLSQFVSEYSLERVVPTCRRATISDGFQHVTTLFESRVVQSGDRIALVGGDCRLSYSDVNRRSNRIAHCLRKQGLIAGDVVGARFERSINNVIAFLGILKAGGVYTPLDPSYPPSRLEGILKEGDVKWLIGEERVETESEFLDIAEALSGDFSEENPGVECLGASPAYVVFTSGSTGAPKGVLVDHESLSRRYSDWDHVYGLEGFRCYLQAAGQSFDVSIADYVRSLCSGGTLVVADREALRDPALLANVIEQEGIEFADFVPSLLRVLSEYAVLAGRVFSSMRCLVVGGDVWHDADTQNVFQITSSDCRFFNAYGVTEAVIDNTYHEIRRESSVSSHLIGRPFGSTELHVVDEGMRRVPVGVAGELLIGGALARGYINQATLTSERFVADPFSSEPGSRLYKSGDLVRWLPSGDLEFIGRSDDQVKIRGYRIELGEIENVLLRAAGVRDAVVVVHEGETGQKCLVGYVVLESGWESAGIMSVLASQLPAYMVPSQLMVLDVLPLTANGKVDRRSLPSPTFEERRDVYEAPRTAIEEALATIWAEVLGIDRVGVTDNFFALGGDSIMSIQIVSRARQKGIAFSVKELFEQPTIAELAANAEWVEVGSSRMQSTVSGSMSLVPIQRQFLSGESVDQHHYNQSVLLIPPKDFSMRRMKSIVSSWYERHDALRLRFVNGVQGWQADHAAFSEALCASSVIHEELPVGRNRKEWLKERSDHWQRSLSLSSGPLLRVIWFDGGGSWGRVLVIVHHLVVDGVSWRVLLQDLESGYRQLRLGESVQLAQKSDSYQWWGERLQRFSESEVLQEEREYWLDQLQCVADIRLPLEAAKGVDNTHAATESVDVELTVEQTSLLLGRCNTAYRTEINELLLSALLLGLQHWCGGTRLRIELEGHGRELLDDGQDLSETVGWFTTVYPLVLSYETEVGALIRQVKESYRCLPNKGLGYGVLRYLAEDEAVNAAAADSQCDVEFNYLGQFDQSINTDTAFQMASEQGGIGVSSSRQRSTLLSVSGMVFEGVLSFTLDYNRYQFSSASVAQVAECLREGLETVIVHTAERLKGSYTPSDFALARVTQRELDDWSAKYVELDKLYPATPMQQGMLFHSLLDASAYVTQTHLEFSGHLNVEAFRAAWKSLIARHDILRTQFVGLDTEQIHQLVTESAELPWLEFDIRHLNEAEQQSAIDDYAESDRHRGFWIDKAPLMRIALWQLADDRFHLLWTYHHALLDGWSMPIVCKDLVGAYNSAASGADSDQGRAVPFERFIAWHQREKIADAIRFWQEELGDVLHPTPLPFGGVYDLQYEDTSKQEVAVRFSAVDTEKVTAFARENAVTTSTIIQAAWALLLHSYSHETDIVFGTTISGRLADIPDVDSIVGLCINTVPTKISVATNNTVSAWLTEINLRQAERDAHGFLSLTNIQNCSKISGEHKLFDSVIVFENYPAIGELTTDMGMGMVGIEEAKAHTLETTNYDLTLVCLAEERLTITFSYDPARFSKQVISIISEKLETLVHEMTDCAAASVANIACKLHPKERSLFGKWGCGRRAHHEPLCVHEIFERQAAQSPAVPAVICNGKSLSYEELNSRADRLASLLADVLSSQGQTVAVCLPNSVDAIVAIIGILKAGSAYLPIDISTPLLYQKRQIKDAGCVLIVCLSDSRDDYEAFGVSLCIDEVSYDKNDVRERHNHMQRVHIDDPAYVIFTSGSTGRPKGVVVAHRGVSNLVLSRSAFSIGRCDTMLQYSALSFDVSVLEWASALCSGASLLIVDSKLRMDFRAVTKLMQVHEVTHALFTISVLRQLSPEKLPKLRTVIVGGEKADRRLIDDWMPGRTVISSYGPTETTIAATGARFKRGDGRVLIGKPNANVRCYVVGPAGGLAPLGVPGELIIAGAGVARGYVGDVGPAASRFGSFSEDGFHEGWVYRTGDIVKWHSDGNLEFCGRLDRQVKLRGHRIELEEIESQLQQFPGIAEVVVGVSDAPNVKESSLVCHFVSRNGGVQEADIRGWLSKRLPSHMLPNRYFELEAMPQNRHGKLDRAALSMLQTTVPDKPQVSSVPWSALEESIHHMWCELLGHRGFGTKDSFFAVGGHSMLAVRLGRQIEKQFGIELSMSELMEEPTVQRLSQRVREGQKVNWLLAEKWAEDSSDNEEEIIL